VSGEADDGTPAEASDDPWASAVASDGADDAAQAADGDAAPTAEEPEPALSGAARA